MTTTACTAFGGDKILASGPPAEVALAIKAAARRGVAEPILIFDDASGTQLDFDLSGSDEAIAARLAPDAGQPPSRGRGRPKLGVVAREVTLLPRHWDWLNAQPAGASATLRRLVDTAQRDPAARRKRRQEAAYRFLNAIAGDRPGYEEALRALFAGDRDGFAAQIADWPADIGAHALKLAFGGDTP